MFSGGLVKLTDDRCTRIRECGISGKVVAAALIQEREHTERSAMQQPIGEKVQRPNVVWVQRNPKHLTTHVLRPTATPTTSNLQIRQTVKSPESLVVHVGIVLARLTLVDHVQALAAVARVLLCKVRQSDNQGCVLRGFNT